MAVNGFEASVGALTDEQFPAKTRRISRRASRPARRSMN